MKNLFWLTKTEKEVIDKRMSQIINNMCIAGTAFCIGLIIGLYYGSQMGNEKKQEKPKPVSKRKFIKNKRIIELAWSRVAEANKYKYTKREYYGGR